MDESKSMNKMVKVAGRVICKHCLNFKTLVNALGNFLGKFCFANDLVTNELLLWK